MNSNHPILRFFRYLKAHPKFAVGLILTTIFVLLALIGQFWTPYSVTKMDASGINLSPSLTHWMGTDNFGRDVFSRVMKGLGTTLFVALITVACGCVIGAAVGAVTGYFGGVVDNVIMRMNDILLAFPSVLLALILISFMGTGTLNTVVALSILFIPSFARIVRGEVIRLKSRDFVSNARIHGVGTFRIIFVHILPNVKTELMSAILIGFNNAVLAEASMSYLGLGVQPPDPSLGRMLSEASGNLYICPWSVLGPGLAMVLVILGFSLLEAEE